MWEVVKAGEHGYKRHMKAVVCTSSWWQAFGVWFVTYCLMMEPCRIRRVH